MTTRRQREFLKVQQLETERLRELAGDHPLMAPALAERAEDIGRQLAELPVGKKEPRTVLFFSGKPVQGSLGIDANFAGRILEPFQNMVMADYAGRWHGPVGGRGRRAGEAEARMLLTGLPRGSFGMELTKASNEELFDEEQLADTLTHVTRLVESASRSDEDFAAELNETAPRVIQNLREFLEVVSKGEAGMRLETGDLRCTMTPIQAHEAFERVSDTITNEEEVELPGVFKGLLLESWRFDFVDQQGHKISGRVDENLTQQEAGGMAREFYDRQCDASLLKTTVLFKNGRIRTTYTLRNLKKSPSARESDTPPAE